MSKFKNESTIGGLVLTRREGEQITINNGEVIVEVVEIKQNTVRLAFKAAKNVSILRAEAVKLEADTAK